MTASFCPGISAAASCAAATGVSAGGALAELEEAADDGASLAGAVVGAGAEGPLEADGDAEEPEGAA